MRLVTTAGKELVQATFRPGREGLIANVERYAKYGVVAGEYTRSKAREDHPNDGEKWLCEVGQDTRPDNRWKGVLVLWPVSRMDETIAWELAAEHADGIDLRQCWKFGGKITKQRTLRVASAKKIPADVPEWLRDRVVQLLDARRYNQLGCQVKGDGILCVSLLPKPGAPEAERQKFYLQDKKDIDPHWPIKLQLEIESRLKEIEDCRIAADLERIRLRRAQAAVVAKPAPAPIKTPSILDRLTGKTIVTVQEIRYEEHVVTVIPYQTTLQVLVDGVSVGLRGPNTSLDWRPTDAPVTVKTTIIVLSNGTQVAVSNKRLSVRKWEGEEPESGWRPASSEMEPVFREMVSLPLFSMTSTNRDVSIAFTGAQGLAEGTELGYEFPFQWVNDFLWNGKIRFPRKRPEKGEWHQYPIKSVSEAGWPMFLKDLEGRFGSDLPAVHKKATTRPKGPPKAQMTERQKALAAVIAGQMWSPTEEQCKRVTIGACLIFHALTASGKTVYIVDNPGVGRLWRFWKLEDAEALASGTLSRTEARLQGHKGIIHREGWQNEVAADLQAA